jgi:hypothetical protein
LSGVYVLEARVMARAEHKSVVRQHACVTAWAGGCPRVTVGATTKSKEKVDERVAFEMVVGHSARVLELPSAVNKSKLVRRKPEFRLDFGLEGRDGVESTGLEGECFGEAFDNKLYFFLATGVWSGVDRRMAAGEGEVCRWSLALYWLDVAYESVRGRQCIGGPRSENRAYSL